MRLSRSLSIRIRHRDEHLALTMSCDSRDTTPSGTSHLFYDRAGRLVVEADAATGATLREYVWLEVEDYEVERRPNAPAGERQSRDRPIRRRRERQ